MKQCKFLLLGVIVLFGLQAVPVFAQEDVVDVDVETEAVVETKAEDAAAANEYLLENIKQLELADTSYSGGDYDGAVKYAQEAIRLAGVSDSYVTLQVAQERMDWAEKSGAPKNHPEMYGEALAVFTEALAARDREDWESVGTLARQVIEILRSLPARPVLAAQYRVTSWVPMKDCLWNIAGKPEIYGDPHKWRVIFNANKSKFPDSNNPNLIEPGMVLDIPSIAGELRAGVLTSE